MQTIISSEQDLIDYKQPFPNDVVMIHFKMVGVGSQTLEKAQFLGKNVVSLAGEQPGFFLIGTDVKSLRDAMHELVDRFCDIQGGLDEPKNQEIKQE